MALDANTVYEIRVDGNANNGGGFNPTRDAVNGVDYSQQTAAQLALTDLYCHNDTGLHSDTGGFTHAMEGNLIHIVSGTHFTAGWYEIVTYVSANEVTLDRAPVTADNSDHKDGVGNVGGAFALGTALDDDFFELVGSIWYIKSGTHAALGETVAINQTGTAATPKRIIGYITNRTTRPYGDDRPLVQCAAQYFAVSGSWWIVENLRLTGTATTGVFYVSIANVIVYNCKATNSSVSANRPAFISASTACYWIGCEGVSTNGAAFSAGTALHCYAHDSAKGFDAPAGTFFCVADTCTTYGISQASGLTLNCTTYNCGTNVYFSGALGISVLLSTILDAGVTGVDASAQKESSFLAFNCFDNTTDLAANVDGSVQDSNQTGDPGLADPANGDFRITDADAKVYELGLDVQVHTSAIVR